MSPVKAAQAFLDLPFQQFEFLFQIFISTLFPAFVNPVPPLDQLLGFIVNPWVAWFLFSLLVGDIFCEGLAKASLEFCPYVFYSTVFMEDGHNAIVQLTCCMF